MRNLSLPDSEAAAVQSRGGPAGPSAASREAASLTGGCGAKLRRFVGLIGRGRSVAGVGREGPENGFGRAGVRPEGCSWVVSGRRAASGGGETGDLLLCRLCLVCALGVGEDQRHRLHR